MVQIVTKLMQKRKSRSMKADASNSDDTAHISNDALCQLETESSAELLEGALRRGEQSFFPKLSQDVEVLIDTVNHEKTQDYIQKKIDEKITLSCEQQINDIIRAAGRMCSDNDEECHRIVKKCDELEHMCDNIRHSGSVYNMLKELKTFLNILSNDIDFKMTVGIRQQTDYTVYTPGMACPWRCNYLQLRCIAAQWNIVIFTKTNSVAATAIGS